MYTELGEYDFIALNAVKTATATTGWKWVRGGNAILTTHMGIDPAKFPGTGDCLGLDTNGEVTTFSCTYLRRTICE